MVANRIIETLDDQSYTYVSDIVDALRAADYSPSAYVDTFAIAGDLETLVLLCDVVRRLGISETLPPLIALLSHPEERLKQAAAEAIATLDIPSDVAGLRLLEILEELQSDPDLSLRHFIVMALAASRYSPARPLIQRQVGLGNEVLDRLATHALQFLEADGAGH